MRKVVLFAHVSLDGYAAGPNGELDWISYDGELQKYADALISDVGMPMYGRVTYHMMENYWPSVLQDPSGKSKHEIDHAKWIEQVDKVVFSRTLKKTVWKNTKVISNNLKVEVNQLKGQSGKNLVIFGSPGLAQALMKLDLIDEFQLTLNPVILGHGIPLFKGIVDPAPLRLIKATTLSSGVIGLHYERNRVLT